MPSTSIEHLHVTRELCENQAKFLTELVNKNAFEAFIKQFYDKTKITIEFSSAAYQAAEEMASTKGIMLSDLLHSTLKNYEHGLKLTGKEKFTITANVIKNSQSFK